MQSITDRSILISKSTSHVRDLQHKLDNLQQSVFDLSHQIRSLRYPINDDYKSGHSAVISSCSRSSVRLDTSTGLDHFYRVQEVLDKTTAALERRDAENYLLRKEFDELHSSQSLLHTDSVTTSMPFARTVQSSSPHLHSSTFIPTESDPQSKNRSSIHDPEIGNLRKSRNLTDNYTMKKIKEIKKFKK